MKNLKKWKCKVCGSVQESISLPESCLLCDSKEFEKMDADKIFDIETLETTEKKKKYRRIFKKGFTRKYKKFK